MYSRASRDTNPTIGKRLDYVGALDRTEIDEHRRGSNALLDADEQVRPAAERLRARIGQETSSFLECRRALVGERAHDKIMEALGILCQVLPRSQPGKDLPSA